MFDKINIHRVLIAPLDWGLGHTTRCIPLIKALLTNGYEVIIASEGAPALLLAEEFPALTILPLKGYRVRYAKTAKGLVWQLLQQLPNIIGTIYQEHNWLQQIIKDQKIDLVISDNRFGLFTRQIPCVFITHQLTIKAPIVWVENFMRGINYYFINRFTACWVPDNEGTHNLAGLLSHPIKLPKTPVSYLGILTRIEKVVTPTVYQYCFLLSGPEPQRSILEAKILSKIAKLKGDILLLRGMPASTQKLVLAENIHVFNHLPSKEIQAAILASELVICRSGYSTLMELVSVQKKALLIATPGQTEQAYLAKRLAAQNIFYSVDQQDFDVIKDLALAKSSNYILPEIPVFQTNSLNALLQAL